MFDKLNLSFGVNISVFSLPDNTWQQTVNLFDTSPHPSTLSCHMVLYCTLLCLVVLWVVSEVCPLLRKVNLNLQPRFTILWCLPLNSAYGFISSSTVFPSMDFLMTKGCFKRGGIFGNNSGTPLGSGLQDQYKRPVTSNICQLIGECPKYWRLFPSRKFHVLSGIHLLKRCVQLHSYAVCNKVVTGGWWMKSVPLSRKEILQPSLWRILKERNIDKWI